MPNRFEPLIIGLAMITMGSTLTALIKPQKSIWQTLKHWMAGIVAGILVMLFAWKNDYDGKIKDLIMITVATFVTSIYPIVETFVKLYLIKRSEGEVGKTLESKLPIEAKEAGDNSKKN